jgi:pimeloyl-ACP methyl ester carboxylesterase
VELQFLEHSGHAIYWHAGGDKSNPLLLLIHGFPTSSHDWASIWDELIMRYHVIALDLLGFGRSAKPLVANYSIFLQADIVDQLLRHLVAKTFHVLAHDYGDTVAQELLARDLEKPGRPKLASMCFLNGGLFPETHRPLLMQKLLLSPLGAIAARLSSKRLFAKNMRAIFGANTPPSDAFIVQSWDLLCTNNGKHVLPKLIHYVRERVTQRERWVGAMQKTTVPLKLIVGMDDPISGAHMVRRYEQLITAANVSALPGIGHYPQVEASLAVLREYFEFRQNF